MGPYFSVPRQPVGLSHIDRLPWTCIRANFTRGNRQSTGWHASGGRSCHCCPGLGAEFREGKKLMEIFVANLSFASAEADLRQLFDAFGAVERVIIVKDRETGRSRGFGFVGMPNEDEARDAIEGLNGTEFQGRTLAINEARPREPRSNRRNG